MPLPPLLQTASRKATVLEPPRGIHKGAETKASPRSRCHASVGTYRAISGRELMSIKAGRLVFEATHDGVLLYRQIRDLEKEDGI